MTAAERESERGRERAKNYAAASAWRERGRKEGTTLHWAPYLIVNFRRFSASRNLNFAVFRLAQVAPTPHNSVWALRVCGDATALLDGR